MFLFVQDKQQFDVCAQISEQFFIIKSHPVKQFLHLNLPFKNCMVSYSFTAFKIQIPAIRQSVTFAAHFFI